MKGLSECGIKPIQTEGGFFVMADISMVEVPEKYLNEPSIAKSVMTRDWAFCRFLTIEIGVTALPCGAFHHPLCEDLGSRFARFAFCKDDHILEEACSRLLKLK